MKLERTVLWTEKDLFLEDGDPAIGFLGFLRGCFCESGLQTDENLPETVRAEYAEVLHFLCSPDARRILCGKVQMEGYCRNRRKSHVPMAFGRECWGFRRQFSLFVYDRMTLMTALAARVGLPERCYGVQPFMGERILIRYGEDSYELFPQYGCNATENRKYATERNREFCVTLAQVAAMENGSVYGWDTPMADVRNYDKDGHYFPMEEQKGEKKR